MLPETEEEAIKIAKQNNIALKVSSFKFKKFTNKN